MGRHAKSGWRAGVFSAVFGMCLAAPVAFAGSDPGGDLPETLLSEPAVLGLINNGDESVVDTIYIYLDGCPLLSIRPPPTGVGDPEVTVVERDGACTVTDSSDPSIEYLAAMGFGVSEGMHVRLQRDEGVDDPDVPGNALIMDISNLYPRPFLPGGGQPRFWPPGVFGDPSGDLVVASSGDGPATLFNRNRNAGGFAGGGGGSGGPGGGGGGGTGGPGGPFANPGPLPNPGAETGGPGVASIPLPASLFLLMGALVWLRSFLQRT